MSFVVRLDVELCDVSWFITDVKCIYFVAVLMLEVLHFLVVRSTLRLKNDAI